MSYLKYRTLATQRRARLFTALDIYQLQQRQAACDTLEGICRDLDSRKAARLSVKPFPGAEPFDS